MPLRFGIVSEFDASKGLARVKFEDDETVSDWLPLSFRNTKENKDEFPLDANERVWVLMDEHSENGVIGGAIYDSNNAPEVGNKNVWVKKFKDGTKITYDRENSVLTVDCKGDVIVKADGDITLDNDEVTITGDLSVSGKISADGNIESQQNVTAGINVEANAEVKALASSVGVNLSTHVHPYVDTPVGGATTSPPTPGT